jgi:predicted nucleic-acid-binding Zn-ribbon protein
MAGCPKCRGAMTEGFAYSQGDGGRLRWIDGEANFWTSLIAGFRTRTSPLEARRCSQCGYVEFFVSDQSQPVKTLKTVDEENQHLRKLVATLQHRVETLEAIATDPAERTAREIESLRSLPAPEGEVNK